MKDKIALYPGTFDPLTLGHLDIIIRAAKLFKTVYVGLAENSSKNTMFTLQQRELMCQKACQACDNVEIITFSGLVVEFAATHHVDVLVRGIRNVSDISYEMQMAQSNYLMTGVETIFLPTHFAYAHINSTFIREIITGDQDLSLFLPKEVSRIITS